jgi:hypothetical protein
MLAFLFRASAEPYKSWFVLLCLSQTLPPFSSFLLYIFSQMKLTLSLFTLSALLTAVRSVDFAVTFHEQERCRQDGSSKWLEDVYTCNFCVQPDGFVDPDPTNKGYGSIAISPSMPHNWTFTSYGGDYCAPGTGWNTQAGPGCLDATSEARRIRSVYIGCPIAENEKRDPKTKE